MKRGHALVAVAIAATTVLPATAAYADPPATIDVTLYCGEEVVPVSVGGNGAWTPAHALNSTLVGVPLAFGEFSGTFYPTGGDPISFTDPPFAKKNFPKTRNILVDCTYTVSGASPDGTFVGEGSVTLMVPRIH